MGGSSSKNVEARKKASTRRKPKANDPEPIEEVFFEAGGRSFDRVPLI
jgi:hypothetical protein